MQNTKIQKDFTIDELLVVMAVIGILITLAVVEYRQSKFTTSTWYR
jgi:prepilin-type N-terminal cleavage/methylation domain-containing protein